MGSAQWTFVFVFFVPLLHVCVVWGVSTYMQLLLLSSLGRGHCLVHGYSVVVMVVVAVALYV